jgi:hypothetical protein
MLCPVAARENSPLYLAGISPAANAAVGSSATPAAAINDLSIASSPGPNAPSPDREAGMTAGRPAEQMIRQSKPPDGSGHLRQY